jgi:hypothetical protein
VKRQRSRQLSRHRVALAVVGLILVAAGTLGALLAYGAIDRVTDWFVESEPLLNESLDDALRSDTVLFQASALAAGVILVLIGLVWLVGLIPPRRRHQDHEFANSATVRGRNIVRGGALAGAIEDDIERHSDVDRAVAEFLPDEQLIRLSISASDSMPLDRLNAEVVAPAVDRAVTVSELGEEPEVLTDVRFVEQRRTVV